MGNTIETRPTGEPGVFVSRARHNYLVSGASPERGGDGNALLAGELFLAALTGCAISLVTALAAEQRVAIKSLKVTAASEKDAQHPGHYAAVDLHFHFDGLNAQAAEGLVAQFQQLCPIYGTISRGAHLQVHVHANAA